VQCGVTACAGGRKPTAEEAAGGIDAERVDIEGFTKKKLTRSAADSDPLSNRLNEDCLGQSFI
jgi:hypothetical protein